MCSFSHLIIFICLFSILDVFAKPVDKDDDVKTEFDCFQKNYSKEYKSSTEKDFRFTIFLNNSDYIKRQNNQNNFKVAMNKFSDLNNEEYNLIYNLFKMPNSIRRREKKATARIMGLPASIDWRIQGYVSEVKDQGQCGSCWSFSSTGALEGQYKKASGNLLSLSEQNLIDCVTTVSTNGCFGGWMGDAFDYVKNNNGINTESSYPYQGFKLSCRYNNLNVGVVSSGYTFIANDEYSLQQAVATIGPISVAIDASKISFQLYSTGVYYEPACSQTNLNHAVLVVGYGTDSVSGDYWIVKNSWGKNWGMNGYIMMARNKNNNCGIATVALYPTVTSTNMPTIIASTIATSIMSTKSTTSTKITTRTTTTTTIATTTTSKGGSSSLITSDRFGSISLSGYSFQINIASLQQIIVYISSTFESSNSYVFSLGFQFLNGTKTVYGSTFSTTGYGLRFNNLMLTGVYIRSSSFINSLQFQLYNPSLNTYIKTVQLGGTGGTLTSLDSATKNSAFLQISSISGFVDTSGQIFSFPFVRSLTIGYIYQPK